MKILHVISDLSPKTGGPVSAVLGLSETQRELGHEVRIATTDYRLPAKDRDEANVVCRCTFPFWRYAPSLKGQLTNMVQWADAVHVHTIWEYPTLVALRLARKLNKPCLLRPCGMLDPWSLNQSQLKKRLYMGLFSRDIFFPGVRLHFTTIAEQEKSLYPSGIGSVVIGNGLAESAFVPRDKTEGFFSVFPSLRDKKIILFLGRVHPKKQPDVAIEAFACIADTYPDVYLVIAGPYRAEYRKQLESLVTGMGVEERVLFTGMLSGKALYGAYRAACMYVLPSHQENFGITVAEAMAGYCPVIVSQNVDIKDLVASGNAGKVCATESKDVSDNMRFFLDNPLLAKKTGENGRRVAEGCFRWRQIAERLTLVYESLQKKQYSKRSPM